MQPSRHTENHLDRPKNKSAKYFIFFTWRLYLILLGVQPDVQPGAEVMGALPVWG